MTEPTRKLAAIMFTDIAGFTALSAKDEERALRLIDKQRETLKPIVDEFGGSWLKEIGDGLLLSFPSSKQAVNCAIKIQQVTKEIKDLNLRIGIHQGDILVKDGDVFGDDVNIASRIEPFAAIGGVAITRKVQEDISSSPEFITKYFGQPKLKGVQQNVRVYCITSHGLPETKLSEVSAKLEKRPVYWIRWAVFTLVIIATAIYYLIPKETEVPSVGILYMENLGSEEDEFWARGITEDVIIEVASAGLIRVAPMKEILEFMESNLPLVDISKKLRVKYLLTSSIYKKEDGFNLRAQLIESESGKSVYANKWSEPLDKASTITGILAENILNSLGVSTTLDVSKPVTINTDAYEFYLKGKYKWEKRQNREDIEVARGLLQKAISLDQNLIKAKWELGESYEVTSNYSRAMEILEEALVKSKQLGSKTDEAGTLRLMGNIFKSKDEYEKAFVYYEQSLKIARAIGNRHDEKASLIGIGNIYHDKHDYDKAVELWEQAVAIDRELNDRHAEGVALQRLGHIYLHKGDDEKILKYYEQSLAINQELGEKEEEWASLISIGVFYRNKKRDFEKALKYYGQALEISRDLGDRNKESDTLYKIAYIYNLKNDYEKALNYYGQSLEIYSMLDEKSGEGNTLHSIALVYDDIGEYDRALEYFERSLNIRHNIGEKSGGAHILDHIGSIYMDIGYFQKALVYYENGLAIQRELNDKEGVELFLGYIGSIYSDNGDYNRALEQYENALKIGRELGDKFREGVSLHKMGEVKFLVGEHTFSSAYFDSASAIWNELKDKKQNLWTFSWWALSELRSGNKQLAKDKVLEVEKIMKSTNPHADDIIIFNWNLYQVYSDMGDAKKTTKYLNIAHNEVINRANKFKDLKYRESFLTNIRENREVITAWKEMNK